LADAIVVGAGICGAAAAHFLTECGAEVLVIEAGAVASGSTGKGEGNVLVCDKPAGPERELALLGRELWSRLGERFPAARVTRKGALLLEPPGGGGDGGHEPGLAAGVGARHEPDDLQVDPAAAARALLDSIPVRTATRVAAVEPQAVVLADGSRLRADAVVVATGAWAAALSGLPVEPRKGQLAALAAPPGLVRHKLIEAAYVAAVESADPGRQVAAVIEQTLDGDEVLVGSSRERVGFDARVDPALTRAMLARAARFFPALAELPVRREWCGFRAWLPDGLPAVGQTAEGIWVTTGQEGSGVCLGPICGELLATAIAGGQPRFDLSPFDPRRFGGRGSAAGRGGREEASRARSRDASAGSR
jgi:glycine/D-amino acid oxidase-like deaminating enzyme